MSSCCTDVVRNIFHSLSSRSEMLALVMTRTAWKPILPHPHLASFGRLVMSSLTAKTDISFAK
jgi:hypothetical protein